jgi:hypothetical protein
MWTFCPRALHAGYAAVLTATTIETATASRVELDGGSTLVADIIVAVTALGMCLVGGHISIGNKPVVNWYYGEKIFSGTGAWCPGCANMFFMKVHSNVSLTRGADSMATNMGRV